MSRPLRIEFPGALYHVTARGDGRDAIYLCDRDRSTFLTVLEQVCDRFQWLCHAYCLMTNHYHLLIETPAANLGRGMRQLNGVYTQRFNRRHDRVGHVYQGRYTAILVQKERHLLEVARYIVLNPVRAGMVRSAREWHWSSYRATAGLTAPPRWLHAEWLLAAFGTSRHRATVEYRQFVRDGRRDPPPWRHLKHRLYLGEERFVEATHARVGGRSLSAEIPSPQRRPSPPSSPRRRRTGASLDRDRAIIAAYRNDGHSMTTVADQFGVHYSTVSRIVRAAEHARCKT
jgi:REP element-mobilizing transposase RayT